MQAGVSPDRTARGDILFGYAFESLPRPDAVDPAPPVSASTLVLFLRLQLPPPDAPIVSQNYTDFAMVKPDPALTWDQVSKLDPATCRHASCSIRQRPGSRQFARSPGWVLGRSWPDTIRRRCKDCFMCGSKPMGERGTKGKSPSGVMFEIIAKDQKP